MQPRHDYITIINSAVFGEKKTERRECESLSSKRSRTGFANYCFMKVHEVMKIIMKLSGLMTQCECN